MRRSTVILLILFLLLAALVWYTQQPDNQITKALATSTNTPSFMTELLVKPEKGPLSRVNFQDPQGKIVTLDKTSGIWVLLPGQNAPLDQDLAESAAGHALNLLVTKTLDSAPDPAGTGLDHPVLVVSVTLADGSQFSFSIGKETVTGSGYYVLTPDGKVRIVSKSDLDALTANFTEPPLVPAAATADPETTTPEP